MKSFIKTLTLVLALLLGWTANAQVGDLIFSTGVDTTQWLALSSSATTFTGPASASGDSYSPGVQQIGFTFNFAGVDYTQFSCNSDGNLRFGSTVTGTSNYTQPFSSTNAGTNGPKINGMGRDGRMAEGSSPYTNHAYIKHEVQGTAPNRVLVVEYHNASYSTSPSPCTETYFQVQLYETTNIVKLVYGQRPAQTTTTGFQIGLATSASDVATINSRTHTVSYGATTTLNTPASTSDTACYPEQGRWYQFAPSTCPSPSTATASNVTTTSADLAWTAGGSETQWEVVCSATPLSDPSTSSDLQTVTTPSVSLTGLNHSTLYHLYVRALCSATDQSSWRHSTFTTACDVVSTFPWTMDFDSYAGSTTTTVGAAANNLPTCWNFQNTGTSTTYSGYPMIYNSSSYAHSGTNTLRFYTYITAGTYSDQIAILPEMQNLSGLQIGFWARCGSTTAAYIQNSRLAIGVYEGGSNFTWIDTVQMTGAVHEYFEVLFNNYTGTGNRIAICGIQPTASYCYINVDDIEVYPIPTCLRPTDLTCSATALDEADLSWVSDHANFEVFVGAPGFSIDTVSALTVSGTTCHLTGLSAGATYEAKVRANCGDGDLSFFGTLTFVMPTSLPFSDFPYSCDFSDATEAAAWELVNSTAVNHWTVGANAYSRSGNAALYITDGTAHNYTITAPCVVFAHRDFYLEPGDYAVSYDWIAGGESSIDYMRSFLAPGSVEFTASAASSTIPITDLTSTALPAGWIALDGGSYKNLQTSWQNHMQVFHISTAGTYHWVFMWRDDSSVGTQPPAGVDNLQMTQLTCPQPQNLVYFAQPEEMTLAWTPGGNETEWEVFLGQDTLQVTDTFYTFTNLTPATYYTIGVRALCGSDDNSFWTVATAVTGCVEIDQFPWTCNFDSVPGTTATSVAASANNLPVCWGFENHGTSASYSGYPMVYNSSSYAHSGTNTMRFYSYITAGTYSDQIAILPEMQDLDQLQITFYARCGNTTQAYIDNSRLAIGVYEGNGQYTWLDTLQMTSGTTHERFDVPFNHYEGSGNRIAICGIQPTASYCNINVDDITVDYIPACPIPTGLAVSNITASGADLSFVSDASTQEVVVSATPVTDFENVTPDMAYGSPYAITGLNSNTEYYVYLRNYCGGDVSEWVSTTFRTACDYLTTANLPFIEDFNGYATGSTSWMPCWQRINSTADRPYPFASYNHGGTGNGLYFYYGSGGHCIAIMPPVDRDDIQMDQLQLTFWTRQYSTTATYDCSFQVGVMTDPTDMSTFTTVATVRGTAGTTWEEKTVRFDNYQDTGAYIAFKLIPTSSSTTSFYGVIDDVTLEIPSSCAKPLHLVAGNVGEDEALLTWQDTASTGSYTIAVSTVNDIATVDASDYLSTSDLYYQLDQLDPNTTYYVWVRSECTSEPSNWVGTSFHTACTAIPSTDLPYHYGFDDATGSGSAYAINSCWQKFTNSSTAYPYPSTSYHHDGSYSLYFYSTTTPYYSYVVMPLFEDSVNTLQVNFWRYGTSSTYGRIKVGVMTNPNDISTFEEVASLPACSTTWTEATVGFAEYTGQGRYIAFYSDPSVLNYVYLDDITVSPLPECTYVTDLEVDNVTGTSALLTWDYQHGISENIPDSYDIEVVEVVAGSENTLYDVTSPYILSGLQPSTAYLVRVISYCNGDESGRDSVSFSTGCLIGGDKDILGTSTTTTYSVPINTLYNNSFTEQLILADEITGVDTITGIAFQYNYSTALSGQTVTIYMANTNLNALTTASFVDGAALQQVYTGPFNCTQGMNTITLDTAFVPDGRNLVVAVLKAMTTYPGSSYNFNCHTGGPNTLSFYSDTYAPVIGSLASYSGTKTTSSYRCNMKIISPCRNDVSCVPPTVMLDSVVEGTIGFSWVPGLYESSWDVDYRQAGASTWTNLLSNTSQQSAVLTGLQDNTTYDIRVMANCDTGDTAAAYLSATTPCAAFSLPFSEDFSSWGTGTTAAFNPCWHRNTNYTSNYYPYVSTSYGQSLYLYSTSTSWSYAALPLMDAPIDSLCISMDVYRSNSSYLHRFEVGVMTDPTDVSTFQRVAWVTPTQLSVYERFEVNFNTYTGNGRYIALRSPDGEYSYPYIDNILVERIASCPRPSDVTVTNISQTGATVSWTSAATDFEIEYGPAGFQHGQGTLLTSQSNSIALTGLTASTQYEFYVRALCDASDTSNWSFVTRFATACGQMQIPFSENFDHWGTGTTAMPNCWTRLGSTADHPYINATSSYAYGGTGYGLYFYAANSSGYCYAVMPESSVPANQLQVRFASRQYSTSYDCSMVVGVMTNPNDASTFVGIDTVHPATTDYEFYEVSLDQYAGTGRYIAFSSILTTGTYVYLMLDEVSVDYIPACPRMTNLTATNVTTTSVDLGWSDPSSNTTQWQIEYGPRNFTLGTGTRVMASTNPFTLTGLTPGYQGEFYVRPMCTATDTGMWNYTPCPFGTVQVPATIPYLCDFDANNDWSNWQQASTSALHWARGTAAGHPGNGMYVTENDSNAVCSLMLIDNITAYRDIDFGTVDSSFVIEFDFNCGGRTDGNYDGLMIFCVDDFSPVEASATGLMSPWGNINEIDRITFQRATNGWVHVTANIDNVSGLKRLGFYYFYQNSTQAGLDAFTGEMAKLDNLEIDYVSCVRPYDLDVDNITGSSAHLSWTGDPTATYQVTYRVYSQPASTNQSVIVTGNQYTLTGLSASTEYAYWVRKQCGNSWSDYSLGIRFQTLCGIISSFPWSEDFNSTQATTYSTAGVLPNCWLGWTDGSATYFPHVVGSSSYWYSPDNTPSLCMTSGTAGATTYGSHKYVALPQFAGQVSDLTLHFWYKQESATNGSTLTVGYFTSDSLDGNNFVPVRVMPAQATGLYDSVSFDTVTAANAARIGFHWTYTTSFYSCCVDDVTVTSAGLFCLAPSVSVASTDWNQATIAWSNTTGQVEVELRPASQAAWANQPIQVSGFSHTFTGLQPETSYMFRVRQECPEIGYSEWTVGSFTTDELPCSAPTNLAASNVTGTSATLSWTPVSTETQWEVRYAAQGDTASAIATATTLTLTGLFVNVTYTAWVRALCGDGTVVSDWSQPVEFTTTPCPMPTNVTANDVTTTGATISWTAPEGYNDFTLYYGITENTNNMTPVEVTGTSHTLSGLESNTTYYVSLSTRCAEGWVSDLTANISFRTTVGIDDVNANSVSLYPNPATTQVTIEGYEGEVQIVDMTGRVVLRSNDTTIDISTLTAGAYFVKLGTTVKKLIVK